MNKFDNDRIINYGMFSPKIENSRHLRLNKDKKNFGNYSTYSKYTNAVLGTPINLYSNSNLKNKNKLFSPNYSRDSRALSPIHRSDNNKLRKSLSQRNFTSRALTRTSRGLPTVNNHSFIKSPINKRNTNKKIKYTNLNEHFGSKQNFFNLETEKLYQETRQIKKIVKILTNQLTELKKENIEKDKQISIREKQINDIILNNNLSTFENAKNNTNNNTNEQNNNSILSDTNNENSSTFNDSIYANALFSNRNSSTGNLFFKIKKEIKQTNNEIKLEKDKFEKLKRSTFVTKVNELKIESSLYEQQINKINSLLLNALSIKEDNEKKLIEYGDLKASLDKQENLIKNLISITKKLEIEEYELNTNLARNKNELKSKMKEVNLNNSKLNILKKKNELLANEKIIKDEKYTIKINGNPITFNSLYINKINKIKKSINFYKRQIQHSDIEINKLKDKRKKLLESEKLKSIKSESKSSNNDNINVKINKNENLSSPKGVKNIPEEETISNLKKQLFESKEKEKKLEEKIIIYQNKLKEIDNTQKDEKENQSQIEFGIDSDNPYYIEDENNIPEEKNKFTSSQFNQFTYILFKNFESKGIVLDESKNKLINPFIEFVNKNNISEVQYPSNNFDLITEEFTKIILNVLNSDNSYNHTLTKIFISALFYNSECNINKFIEYFNVLFSYTRNYILDEDKYINKLKSKYKEQTQKLIESINNYIAKESKSSNYFSLLKMKELLEQNEIHLKDKYIEFLFYYLKKFDDPEAKLSDLKFSLLNNIIPSISNSNEFKNIENNNSNLNLNNEIDDYKINQDNDNIQNEENKNNISKKESNILDEFEKSKKRKMNGINGVRSPTEEEYSNRRKLKNHTEKNQKENSDDYEDDDEDSMTEITNEEYIKQLTEALAIMQKGLKEANNNFNDLMSNVIQKRKINGVFYECITIEDFNDQLKSINIVLSDLKLSCLCSKYSIPNELRLIDKNKIEKDIEEQLKGNLKFEEEEEEDK